MQWTQASTILACASKQAMRSRGAFTSLQRLKGNWHGALRSHRPCCARLSKEAAADILKANLDAAHSGNRAPLNVYVHPFWLKAESEEHGPNLDQLQEFVGTNRLMDTVSRCLTQSSQQLTPHPHLAADYALSLPDVYFVTMRQLLAWIQDPIPADDLTPEALGCGNPGGAGPAEEL
jgi:hypothetical protein